MVIGFFFRGWWCPFTRRCAENSGDACVSLAIETFQLGRFSFGLFHALIESSESNDGNSSES